MQAIMDQMKANEIGARRSQEALRLVAFCCLFVSVRRTTFPLWSAGRLQSIALQSKMK